MPQRLSLLAVVLVVAVSASESTAAASTAAAQSCGCASDQCCSKWGHCGTGCQAGPCDVPVTNGVSVATIVTPEFFAALVAQADDGCAAKGFYTRDAFLTAGGGYPSFCRTASDDDSKREIAAFFARANHETIKFCYIEEIDGPSKNYCDATRPCAEGKGYYGRRPLQISRNSTAVNNRVAYYQQFGVGPDSDLTC